MAAHDGAGKLGMLLGEEVVYHLFVVVVAVVSEMWRK